MLFLLYLQNMLNENFYYFDDLAAIKPETEIRIKYQTLGRVLFQAIDKRLEGVTVKFAGPLPKIQYLIREYKIREDTKDHSLAIAINATRNRLRHIDNISDSELADAYPHDLKATCKFINYIFSGHAIPESLKEQFPTENQTEYLKRLKDDSGMAVESLRCTIEQWDDEYIYIIRSDNGAPAKVNYAKSDRFSNGNWSYIGKLLVKGEQLNIIRPRSGSDGILMPELIIVNPDYLINVTAIAGCFEEYGCSAIWNLLSRIKPNINTRHTLLGNFAGQLLDEAAYGEHKTYAESMKDFFHDNALALACCTDIDKSFHTDAMLQQKNINNIMHSKSIHLKNRESLSANDLILEPSFLCETLGIQGRMDFIHLSKKTIIEQKSGKGAYSPNPTILKQQLKHYVQLLLYRAVFHYAYGKASYEDIASYLLYSKYTNGLIELGSAPKLLFEAIKIRNQIAWAELHYAQKGMNALMNINPNTLFPQAKGNILWERYQKPQMTELLMPIFKADDLERAYYFRFLQFISTEHVLSKIGNRTKENSGFAAIWNSSNAEKRQAGNIYEKLVMQMPSKYKDDRITDVKFVFDNDVDTDIANFRIGDIVIFYPYKTGNEPDATQEIVFRSTITEIKQDSISLRLRNAQHKKVFEYYNCQDCMWAIEHDFMEASFTALYRSMHAFLSANKERRELILGTRLPETDTSVKLIGNYSTNENSEFNDIVLGAMQAKDVYIIIGPPGTGKTSYGMLNVLKEQLLHTNTSVLLMAYTNRAVDEICSKLKENGIDFLRLGNDFSCSSEYYENLLSRRAENCKTVEDVQRMITEARVVCGTTTALNSHTEIFSLKKFQLAIIDEASQILEPYIVGLLSAKHGKENAIGKFVLIGDEKQLPAVVQQDETESAVMGPELNEIKLTNCRLSFFERLLKIYGKDNTKYCHILTRQGRMHPGIADFPNKAFYGGKLQPVPLPHQKEDTSPIGKGKNWIEDILYTQRTTFISCSPTKNPEEPDKMNSTEADIIAEIVCTAYKIKLEEENGNNFSEKDYDTQKYIGVIVPYRNQISTVRNAIDSKLKMYGLPRCLRDITIDTVERYQGSQRDIIIYGFTIKKYYQLAFLTDNEYLDENENALIDRKLNVAMTRARKHLVMIGNDELLANDETFHKLIEYTKKENCFIRETTNS